VKNKIVIPSANAKLSISQNCHSERSEESAFRFFRAVILSAAKDHGLIAPPRKSMSS
jgi:hypothetical protein